MSTSFKGLFCLVILVYGLIACTPIVPANTPPQLDNTPGAFVVIDDRTFSADEFTVVYPSDWRIVKLNEAINPLWVALISPDNELEIHLSLRQVSPDPIRTRRISDDMQVYFYAYAEDDRFDEALGYLDAIYASLR